MLVCKKGDYTLRKLKLTLRTISIICVFAGIYFYFKAPKYIATHIAINDRVDSMGTAYQMFLLPVLQIIINEVLIYISKKKRQKLQMLELNVILANEWKYIALGLVLLIIFVLLMGNQIALS